ncbi:MAG: prepilin-type N-terminal cleavage/methylation domain-containing protein [Chthoniobacteraceae bacterium]
MRPSFLSLSRHRAFTLIELLVVIAIIAILATILIPVMSSIRAKGDATKCASNLRVIGTGINSYVGEHDGHLPGPLGPLVYPPNVPDQNRETGSLVAFIGEYLGAKERDNQADGQRKIENVVKCPAFSRKNPQEPNLPPFVLNFADRLPDYSDRAPWGDLAGASEPVTMAVLTEWRNVEQDQRDATPNGMRNLSRTWAIKDADQLSFIDQERPTAAADLPDGPVHDDYRNALFYDWHVGKLDLEDRPM